MNEKNHRRLVNIMRDAIVLHKLTDQILVFYLESPHYDTVYDFLREGKTIRVSRKK